MAALKGGQFTKADLEFLAEFFHSILESTEKLLNHSSNKSLNSNPEKRWVG